MAQWIVAAALLLALVAGFLAWRYRGESRRTRSELERLRELHSQQLQAPGVLSHELRTPLTVVRGAAELLLDESAGPLTPVQKRFALTIAENSNQVIEMADDLLAEIRLESELFKLRLARVEIRELVRKNVAELRRFHSVPIRLDNHGAPIHLNADPRLLGQAISNVVNNAARHAGDGVAILVAVTDSDEDVTISVSDDGRGITPEERERLFIPFATGGSLRPGTGLGLMVTQKVLELHGGRILVDSIQSRGTTFYLTLPRSWQGTSQLRPEGEVGSARIRADAAERPRTLGEAEQKGVRERDR